MPDGTGTTAAIEKFSNRAWDTGICESHTMDMLAGLAKTGYKPFFAVYSTFLQRAFDQLFQEVEQLAKQLDARSKKSVVVIPTDNAIGQLMILRAFVEGSASQKRAQGQSNRSDARTKSAR
ncbi:MAG: hypothetical protein ABGZ17_11355, partial [Planctomycetaceae bacterium]